MRGDLGFDGKKVIMRALFKIKIARTFKFFKMEGFQTFFRNEAKQFVNNCLVTLL